MYLRVTHEGTLKRGKITQSWSQSEEVGGGGTSFLVILLTPSFSVYDGPALPFKWESSKDKEEGVFTSSLVPCYIPVMLGPFPPPKSQ